MLLRALGNFESSNVINKNLILTDEVMMTTTMFLFISLLILPIWCIKMNIMLIIESTFTVTR